MKIINARIISVLCAAVLSCAALAGCSKSENTDSASKAESGESKSGGDKKAEIFVDEDGIPYYFDKDGVKMMLWASEYEDNTEDMSDLSEQDPVEYIYDEYDKNGISFKIPDGWLVDDSYGAPSVLKGKGQEDVDVDRSISIMPVQMFFGYDIEPNTKVTEKYIKKYYGEMVESGFYNKYELKSTSEGKIGDKTVKRFDIYVDYNGYDIDGNEVKETSRNIIYATNDDNCCLVVINCPDSDEDVKTLTEVYESFADTVKLPNADQIKEIVSQFSGEFEEDDEGVNDDFGDDGEEIVVESPDTPDDPDEPDEKE